MAMDTNNQGEGGSGGVTGIASGDARNTVGLWIAIGIAVLVVGGAVIIYFVK